MDNIPSFKRSESFIGPFSQPFFRLCVRKTNGNGDRRMIEVPYFKAYELKDKKNSYNLVLDDRLCYGPYSEQEIVALAPILADAMAVSAGYGSAGLEEKVNRHNVQVFLIDNAETES